MALFRERARQGLPTQPSAAMVLARPLAGWMLTAGFLTVLSLAAAYALLGPSQAWCATQSSERTPTEMAINSLSVCIFALCAIGMLTKGKASISACIGIGILCILGMSGLWERWFG